MWKKAEAEGNNKAEQPRTQHASRWEALSAVEGGGSDATMALYF